MNANFFHSKTLERATYSEGFTNIFLFMLREEIPQLNKSVSDEFEMPSLSHFAIKAVTGIETDNISTLLLDEILGFNIANTEIYIAGEGSDYSNLPQESLLPTLTNYLKMRNQTKPRSLNHLRR